MNLAIPMQLKTIRIAVTKTQTGCVQNEIDAISSQNSEFLSYFQSNLEICGEQPSRMAGHCY